MLDLRLPKPFMQPEKWSSKRGPGVAALIDLRMMHFSGGALRRFLLSAALEGPIAWYVGRMSNTDQAILGDAAKRGDITKAKVYSARDVNPWLASVFLTAGYDLEMIPSPHEIEPSSYEWSVQVFPRTKNLVDDLTWRRWVHEYVRQRAAEVRCLDDLRMWPAFLKTIASDQTRTHLEMELARALVLYSPHDEEEVDSGRVALNPTLQIISTEKMIALYRMGEELKEVELGWQEAAVIDELNEEPMISRAQLLAKLQQEHANTKLASPKPFEKILTEMKSSGLLR